MNYKLSELENLLSRISELLTYLEKTNYKDREFKMYLSNGDVIKMRVPLSSIPHLLGINTNYLMSTGLFKSKGSFELAKELCENAYLIHKNVSNGTLKYENIFSKFILSKLDRFKDNIKINVRETEFVCKYDSSRSYHVSDKNDKYDYIIVRQYQDGKIGILCLKQHNNYYVPMSNQLYDDISACKAELKHLISYQPITLLNNLVINDEYGYDSKPYKLSYDDKLEKIDNLFAYELEFKTIIDVSGEYKYLIKRLKQNRYSQSEDNDLIEKIAKSISAGKIIEQVNGDYSLSSIVDAFNDFICSDKSGEQTSAKEQYSKLKEELESIKKQLIESQRENKALTDENASLKSSNDSLKQENSDYELREKQIKKILDQKRA